ncbi:MAG: peptidylprolyl isomerase [Clostridia bacterium]|nr:peptidylprolyl isomerase [Clostridia bacterium]
MGKEELSRAEQYRKERKERLAKEAKKNSKRNAAVAKAKSTVLKICAIVVAAAIVFGICVAAFNAAGSTIFRSKVATVGDNKISSVEFSYYYRTIYNFYYQYASQGYDLGFDATISPDEQKYTADDETTTAAESEESETEEGETTSETTTTNYDTWNDFFIDTALNQIKNNYMLNAAAAKEGVKLEESDIKAVDDQIETMETTAKENGYTLNAYIKATYGSNLNSTLLREFLLKDALSQKYTEYKQDEYAASYSNDKVLEEYNNNKTDYDYVDYRAQVFNVSDDQDAAATKALAEDFLAKATSSDAFEAAADEIAIADAVKTAKESASESGEEVDEEVVASEYTDADNTLKEKTKYSDFYSNQEIADWLFNTAKTGDVKLFELKTDDSITSYNVVFCVKAAYKDESSTVNVRHILFKFNEDNTDPTDEQKAVAKQKAEEAYNEWKNGDMTEDSFAAIATEKSEDTGSAANGGLYEDVTEGQMVTAFNDWIFDSARKTGDTDIVETEYGYHVIYFVSKSDTPVWEQTIRDALAQDDYTEYLNEMSESAEYEIEENDLALKMVSKKVNKSIKRYIYNVSRNSAADTAS